MSIIGKQYESLQSTYTVKSVIGEGGAGRALLVSDEDGVEFALKVLTGDRPQSDKLKRFRNEISFCKRCVHPGIIPVLDDGFVIERSAKLPFYVMPLFRGTLRSHIRARLPPDVALRTFVRILDAVEAAHILGVWHRDLKPENILVNDMPDDLVVADFGVAHFAESVLHTAVNTQDTARLANFTYAAPEQRQRGGDVDHRADIFALGLMLNELFTGEVPHGTEHSTIGVVAPHVAYLDSLVDEMLRQNPASRPDSIAHIKRQLAVRGLEYAAQQKLSETRQIVVPASETPVVPEYSFSAFDYQKGRLHITLDAEPPSGWMSFFSDPPGGHTSFVGYGPEQFSLDGKVLSISVPENLIEGVVSHARQYARKASVGLAQKLANDARNNERQAQESLRTRIAEEETRVRVLSRLSKLQSPG